MVGQGQRVKWLATFYGPIILSSSIASLSTHFEPSSGIKNWRKKGTKHKEEIIFLKGANFIFYISKNVQDVVQVEIIFSTR